VNKNEVYEKRELKSYKQNAP